MQCQGINFTFVILLLTPQFTNMDFRKHRKKRWYAHILIIPFIYTPFFALIILDLIMELYHQLGFRLCRLERVKRSAYIRIDRQKLSYLNPIEKMNCMYCGYANGLLHYCAEIVARTEQYWCGIQHQKKGDFIMPEHHKNFTEFGDEEEFKARYKV